MKKLLIIFILLISTCFANKLSFKDKIYKANKGDYIVFEFNKFYSALCVFNLEDNNLILEEITISKDTFDKNLSFRNWIENGAKRNNSWTIYNIDLEENKIQDAFSICKNSWIKLTINESLLTTFLDINLIKLQDNQRKKIGFYQSNNTTDTRPFWNPIKIVDSKKILNPNFKVYRSNWPNDNSEFSCKIIDLYFADDFFFPYFIEIKGNSSYMIRAVDSGNNIKSIIKYFPRKKAEIKQITKNQSNITIQLCNASYYKDFNLFAFDFSKKEKIIHPLNFNLIKEKKAIFLKIPLDYVNKIFEKNHKYKFIVTPKFHKNILIESKELFIWK